MFCSICKSIDMYRAIVYPYILRSDIFLALYVCCYCFFHSLFQTNHKIDVYYIENPLLCICFFYSAKHEDDILMKNSIFFKICISSICCCCYCFSTLFVDSILIWYKAMCNRFTAKFNKRLNTILVCLCVAF